MASGNYMGTIINNNHPELDVFRLNFPVNVGVDDDNYVYVYSYESQRLGLPELKLKFTIEEARKYIKISTKHYLPENKIKAYRIELEVKQKYLEAIERDRLEEEKTKRLLYGNS